MCVYVSMKNIVAEFLDYMKFESLNFNNNIPTAEQLTQMNQKFYIILERTGLWCVYLMIKAVQAVAGTNYGC